MTNCEICNGIDPDCANCELLKQHQEENIMTEPTAPARNVISTALVQNPRTPNQVKDAVRTLNRKLAKLTSWRGISTTLYTLTATLEDGVIAIRLAEPDRTMTGQPDRVWAEELLDVNQSAVSLYRHGKLVHLEGISRQIASYLEANPLITRSPGRDAK